MYKLIDNIKYFIETFNKCIIQNLKFILIYQKEASKIKINEIGKGNLIDRD